MGVFSSWIWQLGRSPSDKFKVGHVLGVGAWGTWGPESLQLFVLLSSINLFFLLDIFSGTQLSFLALEQSSCGQILGPGRAEDYSPCGWHQNVTTCHLHLGFVLAWILLLWFNKTNTLKLSAAQCFYELDMAFSVPGCHSMFYISLFQNAVCVFRKWSCLIV